MFIVRWFLGALILFFEKVASSKGIQRTADDQAKIDTETAKLTLYQFKSCPFCVKVRMAMKRQSLHIETRDAKRSESAAVELLAGGGKLKVPCLKIEDDQGNATWMYESSVINAYLLKRFTAQTA